jgi:hypothetical protein
LLPPNPPQDSCGLIAQRDLPSSASSALGLGLAFNQSHARLHPVALPDTLTEHGARLRLHIADDAESASDEGELALSRLTLSFDSYRGEDEIEVRLNGEVLPSNSSTATFGTWSRFEWTGFPTRLAQVEHDGGRLEFDLACPPLRYGRNELEVRLVRRTVSQPDHLVLVDVEVSLHYNRS